MKLKEYFEKHTITKEEFAFRTKIGFNALWHYIAERRKPRQKIAETIEKMTDGEVTVMELRGEDKRIKKCWRLEN